MGALMNHASDASEDIGQKGGDFLFIIRIEDTSLFLLAPEAPLT